MTKQQFLQESLSKCKKIYQHIERQNINVFRPYIFSEIHSINIEENNVSIRFVNQMNNLIEASILIADGESIYIKFINEEIIIINKDNIQVKPTPNVLEKWIEFIEKIDLYLLMKKLKNI